MRATRFVGTDKNFEELLAHFGIEEPFINPDKANKLLNYAEHVWVRKAPDNYLKEDMIFETQERFDDWIGIEKYGEEEHFRRKASIKRQQRNTDAEIEKREEQRQRKLLRKEREEAEMRRLEKIREEERMKEEERRMNRFTVRSASSGYNRGSSYRTPASTRSRTSSQVARLEDPLPNCGTWYFRPDFSLIGSPVERNRYGRLLPMKQKLLITLMFNPFGIQMRYNYILSLIMITFVGTFENFTINSGTRISHWAQPRRRNQMKSFSVSSRRTSIAIRSLSSMRRI